ncbi:MAG: ECF transporter S component [Tissierella sp.]|nr:ECF transporter S component [Tissierella sp.]
MKARKVVLSGLFIAFGVLLPMIFHQFNMGGPGFLPMHIPVLIAGLFLGPMAGLLVGIVTPIISSVLTGMPPLFPMLPIMIFELGAYGFVSGFFAEKLKMNSYVSLIAAMIVGRIAAGVVVFVLATFFGFKGPGPVLFVQGAIVTGIAGIIIQLVFVPPIARLLNQHVNKA